MASIFPSCFRSAEVILTKILHRAKALSEEGYDFETEPTHFIGFFDGTFTLEDYIALDEGYFIDVFSNWMKEKDPILADLVIALLIVSYFNISNLIRQKIM